MEILDKIEELIYSDVFDKIREKTKNFYINMYEEPRFSLEQIEIALPLLEEAKNKKRYSAVLDYLQTIISFMNLALKQKTFVEFQL